MNLCTSPHTILMLQMLLDLLLVMEAVVITVVEATIQMAFTLARSHRISKDCNVVQSIISKWIMLNLWVKYLVVTDCFIRHDNLSNLISNHLCSSHLCNSHLCNNKWTLFSTKVRLWEEVFNSEVILGFKIKAVGYNINTQIKEFIDREALEVVKTIGITFL